MLVKDGKIAAILAKGDEPEAAKVVMQLAPKQVFLELLILMHILMIRATSGEDYEHGTAAAVVGGYTTIIDMPLQK